MNYQNRFVIFIDILGFKEKIKATIDESRNDKPELIHAVANAMKLTPLLFEGGIGMKKYFSKSKRVTQFSDSIVISFEVEGLDDVFMAIANTRLLILELIYKGFLCRGGIALGKLLHTRRYLFGPALVEAYELESKAAIYPRVIVNQQSLEKAFIAFVLKKKQYSKGDLIDFAEIEKLFAKDFDGNFYLDYFRNIGSEIDEGFEIKYYMQLESLIKAGLASNSEATKMKYYWMREKYNQFVLLAKRPRLWKALKEHKELELLKFCKDLKKI